MVHSVALKCQNGKRMGRYKTLVMNTAENISEKFVWRLAYKLSLAISSILSHPNLKCFNFDSLKHIWQTLFFANISGCTVI